MCWVPIRDIKVISQVCGSLAFLCKSLNLPTWSAPAEIRRNQRAHEGLEIPVFIHILSLISLQHKGGTAHVPTGWAPPPGRLARLRGVRAAGWMGRMPAAGGVWTALGLWRGVMEVSVVGIGSVNLPNKKKHFGLCVNDGKHHKRMKAQTEARHSLMLMGY